MSKREHQLFLIKNLLSDGEWHSLEEFATEIDDSTKKATRLLGQFNLKRRISLDKFQNQIRWMKKL